jgi:hypothetical protein
MEIRTVKDGAILKCQYGIEKSKLKVPDHRGAFLQGGNQAITKDAVVNKNIFSFKYCKKIRNPNEIVDYKEDPNTKQKVPVRACVPKIVLDWIDGQKDYKLRGELALLNICVVPCLDGGIISIEEGGGQL